MDARTVNRDHDSKSSGTSCQSRLTGRESSYGLFHAVGLRLDQGGMKACRQPSERQRVLPAAQRGGGESPATAGLSGGHRYHRPIISAHRFPAFAGLRLRLESGRHSKAGWPGFQSKIISTHRKYLRQRQCGPHQKNALHSVLRQGLRALQQGKTGTSGGADHHPPRRLARPPSTEMKLHDPLQALPPSSPLPPPQRLLVRRRQPTKPVRCNCRRSPHRLPNRRGRSRREDDPKFYRRSRCVSLQRR